MYMRLSRVESSRDQIEQTIANFKAKGLVAPTRATGYADAALYLNRETGQAAGATFWKSAQALAASELLGIVTRTQAAESIGFKILNVERFQVVLDRAQPPRAPAYTRVDNGFAPHERLDEFANFIRDDLTPSLRQRKGLPLDDNKRRPHEWRGRGDLQLVNGPRPRVGRLELRVRSLAGGRVRPQLDQD